MEGIISSFVRNPLSLSLSLSPSFSPSSPIRLLLIGLASYVRPFFIISLSSFFVSLFMLFLSPIGRNGFHNHSGREREREREKTKYAIEEHCVCLTFSSPSPLDYYHDFGFISVVSLSST